MENVPIGTEEKLAEYLFRQLTALETKVNTLTVPHYRTLPIKPIIGNLHYFDNTVLPTITSIGLWVYKTTGWVKIA
jgi:hypothetical protein